MTIRKQKGFKFLSQVKKNFILCRKEVSPTEQLRIQVHGAVLRPTPKIGVTKFLQKCLSFSNFLAHTFQVRSEGAYMTNQNLNKLC